MKTVPDIEKVIKQGESISVEFKKCVSELNYTVFETVCAFLNRQGGHILLGVDDEGNVLGINRNALDNMLKNFANTVNNPEMLNPTYYFSPEIYEIGEKTVICIYIPESSQVHRFKGKIYDRIADADTDITGNHYLVNNLYQRKSQEFTENKVLPYLEIADLDMETFRKARMLASVRAANHPWLTMDEATILRSTGLWRKDNLTGTEGYILAAALLFGKENTVLSCCPAYRTDAIYRNMTCRRFQNPLPTDPDVRYDDRDMVTVNLIEAYSRLMNFVNRNLPDRFFMEGIQRIDIRDKIFREIVANCLLHREFANTFPAKLLIFSDRVITENWTIPTGHNPVTFDNLETHTKNPMLAKVFRELGYAEELGSGRKNINKYASHYYAGFKIEVSNNERFVFSFEYQSSDEEADNTNEEKTTEKTTEKATEKATEKTTEKIIEAMLQNPQITTQQLSDLLRISEDGVWWNINKLKKENKLARQGGRKEGKWIIL